MNVTFDYIRKGLFSLACCFAVLFPSGAASAAEAGRVIGLTPGAYAERQGQRVPLEMKSPVFESDTIITDATGKVQIFFADDGSVTLGPDTALALREVVPEGDKAGFKAHLGQGVARFLTGKIVEANPKGFSVSTPEGTAGIRGTIFVLQTGNGRSTLFVVNASRDVVLNGVSVPGAHKMTIPGGLPTPMTPADLQQAQSLAAARPPASRASGADSGRAAGLGLSSPVDKAVDNESALTPTTLADIGLGTQTLGDSLGGTLPPPSLTGHVSGTLASTFGNTFPGAFSFDVNLSSGVISNGTLSGDGTLSAGPLPLHVDLSGGTGLATSTAFSYTAFTSGSVLVSGTNFDGNSNSSVSENVNLLSKLSGDIVPANYVLRDGFSSIIDRGGGTGTFTK